MHDRTKTLFIETVGCQMNVLDSELVVGSLRRQGYELVHEPTAADVILFTTCSVREHAEEKTYSALGRLSKHKKEHPETVIGVLGCMAQKDQEEVRRRAPHVDMVVGTGQLARVPELVAEVQKTRVPQYALSLGRAEGGKQSVTASFESFDPPRDASMRPTPFQAFVRIQIGCDKFCTYCVVPTTRGPEQSRHPDHLVAECRQLAKEGCKEVTLIGQTVNSYVFDHGDGRRTRLSDLMSRIHDIESIERIKFVTNFPKDMTNDLLDAVRELPKAVKYLHVPVQSGCDEVLKRMKRRHLRQDVINFVERARKARPDVVFGADIIAGFPTETDAMFENSRALVEDLRLTHLHIFPYSEREGTPAAKMPAVEKKIRKQRAKILREEGAKQMQKFLQSRIGKTEKILIESENKGHTEHFVEVQILGYQAGEIIEAEIIGVTENKLVA